MRKNDEAKSIDSKGKKNETAKIMTRKIENRFRKYCIGSQEGRGKDAEVILKVFNPYGSGTWLFTEGEEQDDGDWLLFGVAELYGDWEWGYSMLSDLQKCRVNVMGCRLPLERDMYCEGATVRQLMKR